MKRYYQEDGKHYIWIDGEYTEVALKETRSVDHYGTLYGVSIDTDDYTDTLQMWVCLDGAVFLPWDWTGGEDCGWTVDDAHKAYELDGLPYLSPWDSNPQAATVAEACEVLDITKARIVQLISDGTLTAQKDGGQWLILTDSIAHYWLHRKGPGQPKKVAK